MYANVNVNAKEARPARRIITAKEAAALCAKVRAAAKEAAEAAAAAAEAVKPLGTEGAVIYWEIAAKTAKAKAKEAAAEAARAADIAKEAAKLETLSRFTPRAAAAFAKEAEAAAAVARNAAKEAAEAAAEAVRKPTTAEKRAAAEARIYAAIHEGDKPANVWAAISAEGYILIKRDYFTAAIGEEAAKAYYGSITALCGKVTSALLTYHTAPNDSNENKAFAALREFINRIGVEYGFTTNTVKVLAARAYTFRRTYGEGYTAAALGNAGIMREVLAHITAADTIKEAAAAKAEAEARKEARRRERKAAKRAKAAKKAAAAKNNK